jgi:hypothetical protein
MKNLSKKRRRFCQKKEEIFDQKKEEDLLQRKTFESLKFTLFIFMITFTDMTFTGITLWTKKSNIY